MVAKERSAAAKKGLACSTTTMVFLSVNHRAPLPTSWAPGMLFLFTPGPRTMILPPADREEAERNRVERGGTRENKSIGRRLSVALSLPVIERFRSRGKKKKKTEKSATNGPLVRLVLPIVCSFLDPRAMRHYSGLILQRCRSKRGDEEGKQSQNATRAS